MIARRRTRLPHVQPRASRTGPALRLARLCLLAAGGTAALVLSGLTRATVAGATRATTITRPLAGLGATPAVWQRRHQVDSSTSAGNSISYDPMPASSTGAAEDTFHVTFINGRAAQILQHFTPGTSQATANRAVIALLPGDAKRLVSSMSVGNLCAVGVFKSRALGKLGGVFARGGIAAIYSSSPTGLAQPYVRTDVRSVFLQYTLGTAAGYLSAVRHESPTLTCG